MTFETIHPRQPDSTDVDVGRLVRVHRIARGLSQTELADQIGVTFQQIQKYESGANRISMGRLTRIARVLGVSVTYLLSGSKAATPARSSTKDQAVLAEATRMLGRIGAHRLLKAFRSLPSDRLREIFLHLVEETAAESQIKTKNRSRTQRPSKSRRGRVRQV